MHILMIRHGQSTNNVIEAALGDSREFYQRRTVDPPLSSLGEQQAEALGRYLGAQLRPAAEAGRVFLTCSSMRRAMQTCAPLAAALGLAPIVRPDFVERCAFFSVDAHGKQNPEKGPTRREVIASFPTYDVRLLDETATPALETAADARARATKVAAELLALSASGSEKDTGDERGGEAASPPPPELYVMVAHADFIGMLARALLKAEPPAALDGDTAQPTGHAYYDLNNVSTAHLVLLPPGGGSTYRVRMLHWNRSDHLLEAERSGIAWKNFAGCAQAADWARHGDGGTGRAPLFVEASVVASAVETKRPMYCYYFGAGAVVGGVVVACMRARSAR